MPTSSNHTSNFDFTDRTVLIVGARTGIGFATAAAFAAAGANVVISSRDAEGLNAAAKAIGSDRVVAIPVDIARRDDVEALAERVVQRFGRLDVVVNTSAVFEFHTVENLEDKQWEAMRSVNIDGPLNLARATLPRLEETGGNLVAVSSISGLAGDWGWPAYNATKGAVANLVRGLALDWGRRGVRVNSVAPGVTASKWVEPILEVDGVRQAVENRTALGRVAEPEEVAAAILFVASDAASYITGTVIPVDGGTSASSGLAHIEGVPA